MLRGSEANRKLDIFLTPTDDPLSDGEHDWPSVCTRSVWKSTGAAIHALVHGLRKHDAALGIRQAWTVQLREVDIHKEPERYVKVLAG